MSWKDGDYQKPCLILHAVLSYFRESVHVDLHSISCLSSILRHISRWRNAWLTFEDDIISWGITGSERHRRIMACCDVEGQLLSLSVIYLHCFLESSHFSVIAYLPFRQILFYRSEENSWRYCGTTREADGKYHAHQEDKQKKNKFILGVLEKRS